MFKIRESAKILYLEADRLGLSPHWETADGLFSFLHTGKKVLVYYTKLHGNSQLGSSIAQNKYLTRVVMGTYGYPNIPYYYGNQKNQLHAFFDKNQPVIQKPLFGEKAEGVQRIDDRSHIDSAHLADSIFEKYISGSEYRSLVLDHTVIGMQKKLLASTPTYPWRKHIENIDESQWNTSLARMAVEISRILHLSFVAVDCIVDQQKKVWILEVNSMPGLFSFHHPDAGTPVNVATALLRHIIQSAEVSII